MKTIMFGAALAASLSAVAVAADPTAASGERLSFSLSAKGFDLNRPDEVARLRTKVERQIRRACTAETTTGTHLSIVDAQCVKTMRASADRQIDRQVRIAGEQADGANGG